MREWLKARRLKLNLTQDEVASSAGISRSYYTHIEQGTKTPTVKVAKSIAKIIEANWICFFEEDEDEV